VNKPLNAFMSDMEMFLPGAADGPLDEVTFAAKDIMDIENAITGCGNPDWALTHEPAVKMAPVIEALIEAGAYLKGKTITDELAFSMAGENIHYGTPVNVNAPGRIPGGSSAGSASAVAGEAVDFALGSDTGGSIRVPASHCGIFGIRPSHGRVEISNVMPLAQSYDTIGWFTRNADLLRRVGQVLLDPYGAEKPVSNILIADDAFEMADDAARGALQEQAERIAGIVGASENVRLTKDGLPSIVMPFRYIQSREAWINHGEWIMETKPNLGPGVKERFEFSREAFRKDFASGLIDLIGDNVVVLPSAPGIAPLLNSTAETVDSFRSRALALTAPAGLAGLPQISLPLCTVDNCPVGISIMGGPGSDETLLALAAKITKA
jgi:amidase